MENVAQLVVALAALVSAVAALWTSWRVSHVERATNGMKAQLEAVARAEGVVQGHAEAAAEARAAGAERGPP